MAVLPASVRVALWATSAFAGRLPLEDVAELALPDLDHVNGLTETLGTWREVGERVVLAALPRPGDLTGMPSGPAALTAAATAAEELVFVPGVGGALVPAIEPFGPEGDQGWRADWTAFPADPVPAHRIQQLNLPEIEYHLRADLGALTAELGQVGGFTNAAGLERRARDDLAASWGLPHGVPARALRTVDLAGSVATIARAGLDDRIQGADAATTARRAAVLTRLRDRADRALAEAAVVAALHLAGWR